MHNLHTRRLRRCAPTTCTHTCVLYMCIAYVHIHTQTEKQRKKPTLPFTLKAYNVRTLNDHHSSIHVRTYVRMYTYTHVALYQRMTLLYNTTQRRLSHPYGTRPPHHTHSELTRRRNTAKRFTPMYCSTWNAAKRMVVMTIVGMQLRRSHAKVAIQ